LSLACESWSRALGSTWQLLLNVGLLIGVGVLALRRKWLTEVKRELPVASVRCVRHGYRPKREPTTDYVLPRPACRASPSAGDCRWRRAANGGGRDQKRQRTGEDRVQLSEYQ
jgi:hypothetical protein